MPQGVHIYVGPATRNNPFPFAAVTEKQVSDAFDVRIKELIAEANAAWKKKPAATDCQIILMAILQSDEEWLTERNIAKLVQDTFLYFSRLLADAVMQPDFGNNFPEDAYLKVMGGSDFEIALHGYDMPIVSEVGDDVLVYRVDPVEAHTLLGDLIEPRGDIPKECMLLELPPELRNRIYDFVFGVEGKVMVGRSAGKLTFEAATRANGTVLLPSTDGRDDDARYFGLPKLENMRALSYACKRTYHESAPLFFSTNALAFDWMEDFYRFMTAIPQNQVKFLTTIKITVGSKFDVEKAAGNVSEASKLLSEAKQVSSLTLRTKDSHWFEMSKAARTAMTEALPDGSKKSPRPFKNLAKILPLRNFLDVAVKIALKEAVPNKRHGFAVIGEDNDTEKLNEYFMSAITRAFKNKAEADLAEADLAEAEKVEVDIAGAADLSVQKSTKVQRPRRRENERIK